MVGFVLAMLAISVLPSYLATYREKGILRRLSTTPVRPSRLLQAQLAMGLAMALGAVTLVIGRRRRRRSTPPCPSSPLGFLVAFVLAAASLFAVGLLVAAVAPSGKAAAGIGTVLFFPLMFFAGLWVPREAMPDVREPHRRLHPARRRRAGDAGRLRRGLAGPAAPGGDGGARDRR